MIDISKSKWKEETQEIKTSIKDTISTTIIRNYKCPYCNYTVGSLNDISIFCPMCGENMMIY